MSKATINAIQDEIISDFEYFDDWMDKYDYIISLGKDLPLIDPKYKIESHLIKGCQSQVWLNASTDKELLQFTADSDAVITRGIIALLIKVLSDQPAEAIATAELYFIEKIGLHQHLSPMRSNGLKSMVQKMKLYAMETMAEKPINTLDTEALKEQAIATIKTVIDPEIPTDIYELGLIYKLEIDENAIAHIEMTLTSPMCPVADALPMEVQEKVAMVPGIKDVELKVVFDPPWNKTMMSEEAKFVLDMF